ncbi:unnamed protein product [Ceratitis capitata]|uniref:(Mediterranean fruit fly) hypothetical protein n=1 Tax=Ceratitis capitata TaxID=7213 RepID=A0A811UYT1_CERCA|nr:unnamed protein product [Ceratitis capitata]
MDNALRFLNKLNLLENERIKTSALNNHRNRTTCCSELGRPAQHNKDSTQQQSSEAEGQLKEALQATLIEGRFTICALNVP